MLLLSLLVNPVLEAKQKKAGREFTVIIDAGHGGHDTGAMDNGLKEKDINLAVAKELASLVKDRLKNVNCVMTRDNDTYLTLQKRADIANSNNGDLFISIHTNSVDTKSKNRQSVKGSSVFVLGLHKDDDNMRVAQRENAVIELEENFEQKYSGFDPMKDESYIIFEMAQKKNLSKSINFANEIQHELVSSGRADRGVHQAGFWVLWSTSMPAVLVELDFICNPESAEYLGSQKGSKELAAAIFKALERYYVNWEKTNAGMIAKKIDSSDPILANNNFHVADVSTKTTEVASSSSKVTNSSTQSTGTRRRRNKEGRGAQSNVNYEMTSPVASSNTTADETETVVEENISSQNKVLDNKKNKASKDEKKLKEKQAKKEKKLKEEQAKADRKLQEEQAKTEKKLKEQEAKEEKKSRELDSKERKQKKDQGVMPEKNQGEVKTETLASNTQKTESSTRRNRHDAKRSKIEKIYQIQLFSSEEQLNDNDPRFCGLKPIMTVQENGEYIYYYSESTERTEIEKVFKDIKKLIPSAYIETRERSVRN